MAINHVEKPGEVLFLERGARVVREQLPSTCKACEAEWVSGMENERCPVRIKMVALLEEATRRVDEMEVWHGPVGTETAERDQQPDHQDPMDQGR
jgi:hypothetical protein